MTDLLTSATLAAMAEHPTAIIAIRCKICDRQGGTLKAVKVNQPELDLYEGDYICHPKCKTAGEELAELFSGVTNVRRAQRKLNRVARELADGIQQRRQMKRG